MGGQSLFRPRWYVMHTTSSFLRTAALTVVFSLLLTGPAGAQNDAAVAESAATTAAPDESGATETALSEDSAAEQRSVMDEATSEKLERWSAQVSEDRVAINDLRRQLAGTDGLRREVLATRIESEWSDLLQVALDYAETVADARDKGIDVSDFESRARELLEKFPAAARETLEELGRRIQLDSFTRPVAEQAAIDEQFYKLVRSGIDTRRMLYRAIQLQERFAMDTAADREYLAAELTELAESGSVFLDLAIAEQDGIEAALSAVGDDAELEARLRLAENRVTRTAGLIEANIALMKNLDLPTTQYEKQLLKATGSISTGSLQVSVLTSLAADFLQETRKLLAEQGPKLAIRALLFVLILLAFWKLGALARHGIEHALDRSRVKMSQLLRQMVLSVVGNLVFLLGVLIALSQVGISLGPVLAGLGIVGFIVGFALQDSLSNFASGLMILVYRPFDVGDTIDAAGARGQVNNMTLVNTTILTFDNQSLIVPNNKIWQDVIKNVTAQTRRRVDMEIGVAYDTDIDKVEEVLMGLMQADERVLDDPAPVVKLDSFGDSAINILFRPWVKTEDYWNVMWDLNRQVKTAFDDNGIVIPFPQRDVHHYNQA